jgi:hypothetical protein
MKESSLLSLYDFQKMVALHLIDPEKYLMSGSRQKRKCDDGDDSQTLRSRSDGTKNSSKKSTIVNDKTLHPDQGELRIHLNTRYFHCPVHKGYILSASSMGQWRSKKQKPGKHPPL